MPRTPFAPVKLGVVGLGRFGRLHALTAAVLAEAELVANQATVIAARYGYRRDACRRIAERLGPEAVAAHDRVFAGEPKRPE